MGSKRIVVLFLMFLAPTVGGEQLKTTYNPFTSKLDYITALSSITLPSGSTHYIQNTSTPTISTQEFKVHQGEFLVAGYVMTDADECRWRTTINTSGALVTTLLNCPTPPAGFRPCVTGMSKGLLAAITCSNF